MDTASLAFIATGVLSCAIAFEADFNVVSLFATIIF